MMFCMVHQLGFSCLCQVQFFFQNPGLKCLRPSSNCIKEFTFLPSKKFLFLSIESSSTILRSRLLLPNSLMRISRLNHRLVLCQKRRLPKPLWFCTRVDIKQNKRNRKREKKKEGGNKRTDDKTLTILEY